VRRIPVKYVTKENLVVLKIKEKKADNGKRCDYCISKGWKGLNYTEEECFTKKREKSKNKKARVEESDSNCTDAEGPSIKSTKISIGKT